MSVIPQPPSRRSELKARTRAKLLEAAITTLIEEGYAGFSMNKVAKRAGIAQPSFYHHFTSTDELLEALAQDALDRFIKPFQRSVQTMVQNLPQEQARELIHRLFITALDICHQQRDLVKMVWAERQQPTSPLGRQLRQLFTEIKQVWGDLLVRIGLVGTSPHHQLRLSLFMDGMFALFETYALAWIDGRYDDRDTLAQALTDYVLFYWQQEMADYFRSDRSDSEST